MDAKSISEALKPHRVIALDACILIYFLEGDKRFGPMAGHVVSHVRAGLSRAVLSTVSLLEVQVGPYRRGADDLADRYFALLRELPNVLWVPLTYEIADRAAQLRAERRVEAPDAIQLATALESRATLFVTNDLRLAAIPDIEYLMLGA